MLMAFRMAIKSVIANKMRSFLTMLGIIIGVGAVIILLALVQGASNDINDRLTSMGTNLITVSIRRMSQSSRFITVDELNELAENHADSIAGVAPTVSANGRTVKYGNENISTNMIGTNEVYEEAQNTKVTDGRFITEMDCDNRSKVVLLGTYVAQQLFAYQDPLNKVIKLDGDLYTVVGILEEKSSSVEGSQDDRIIIPYTTATRHIRDTRISTFSVQAVTSESVAAAKVVLEDFLYKKFNNADAYSIFSQDEMMDMVNETIAMMSGMMGGIAGISLLVGGIGIMNIMLVSVTERTREIGIRKAIGAKRGSILIQFLIESIVVSCLGGIVGILFGVSTSGMLGNLLNIPAQATTGVIIGSFMFSFAVGVFFGIYPANKASKLNPIEALRFE